MKPTHAKPHEPLRVPVGRATLRLPAGIGGNSYQDLGSGWHARNTDRSRKARNARRQLEALGYDVIITLRENAA